MADKTLIIAREATAVFVDGTDVGYTLGGIEVTQEITTFEITADQSNAALQNTLQDKKWTIKIPFTESSLENLKLVFTAATASLTSSTKLIFDNTDYPDPFTLGFVVPNQNGDTLTWFWHEVQVESQDAITFNKANQAVYPVTFKAFAATGTNEPGYVYRL